MNHVVVKNEFSSSFFIGKASLVYHHDLHTNPLLFVARRSTMSQFSMSATSTTADSINGTHQQCVCEATEFYSEASLRPTKFSKLPLFLKKCCSVVFTSLLKRATLFWTSDTMRRNCRCLSFSQVSSFNFSHVGQKLDYSACAFASWNNSNQVCTANKPATTQALCAVYWAWVRTNIVISDDISSTMWPSLIPRWPMGKATCGKSSC